MKNLLFVKHPNTNTYNGNYEYSPSPRNFRQLNSTRADSRNGTFKSRARAGRHYFIIPLKLFH